MTGSTLGQLATKARIGLTELATEAGYSREYVTRLVNADRELPDEACERLLMALGRLAMGISLAAHEAALEANVQ